MSNKKQSRKAYVEVLDYPILDSPKREYYICDAYGNKVELSPQEVYDLLEWLSQQREEIIARLLQPQQP